jgi:hypothetical protein
MLKANHLIGFGVGGIDPDAQAFITAAGITDATQRKAINNLVKTLKGYSIWSKLQAAYPIVGGTSTTHKFNLKDPRDADAAFRLSFLGGSWTHSSNGALPNGTTDYADTFFNPVSQSSSTSSFHLSFYKGAAPANGTSRFYMGNSGANLNSTANISDLGFLNAGTAEFGGVASSTNADPERSPTVATAPVGTPGLTCISCNGSRVGNFYLNGSATGSGGTNTGGYENRNIYIGALNQNGTATFFFNQSIRWASIGTGLTATDAGNLFTAAEAFQDALSRGVV